MNTYRGRPYRSIVLAALLVLLALGRSAAQAAGLGGDDIAVWRPSNGTWYVLNRATGVVLTRQLGVAGDIPVAADYDSDGTTDFAVWRPSTGMWFVANSSTGRTWRRQWGTPGDIPVPGNYEIASGNIFDFGASRTELAVFRPSNGTWYVLNRQTGATHTSQLGTAGDVPVPGFYDYYEPTGAPPPARPLPGFYVPTFAVWRPSSGVWFVKNVRSGETSSKQLGTWGDVPVLADYDNDGRTDFAVWRPYDAVTGVTGVWRILNSSTRRVRNRQWGVWGDIPMPRDYDGDGRVDIAIWRPSTGVWWIINSSNGSVATQQWGAYGDVPVHYHVLPPPRSK